MSRQHNPPYLVTDVARRLEPAEKKFDERWLQDFIFKNHSALPINEIEPIFSDIIPICKELQTEAGPIDLLFVNEKGLLTLVECKLWENPEARRQVIGQILDYAKELSRWSYSDLEKAIQKSSKDSRSLHKIVSEYSEPIDESEFIDNLSRNLKRGRFLLLIVGNGIRESTELIANFLQEQAHLNFSFALVELGIFKLPEEIRDGYIVHPRVIAQTVEIKRVVIRIEDGKAIVQAGADTSHETPAGAKKTKISEENFFEVLKQEDAKTALGLEQFLATVQDLGLEIEPGAKSLMMKLVVGDKEFNFGAFKSNGTFQNFGIASRTEHIGHPEIGESYLTRLASLFKDAKVSRQGGTNRFGWTVKKKDGQYLLISECLAVRDTWLELIRETVEQITRVLENT